MNLLLQTELIADEPPAPCAGEPHCKTWIIVDDSSIARTANFMAYNACPAHWYEYLEKITGEWLYENRDWPLARRIIEVGHDVIRKEDKEMKRKKRHFVVDSKQLAFRKLLLDYSDAKIRNETPGQRGVLPARITIFPPLNPKPGGVVPLPPHPQATGVRTRWPANPAMRA